MKVTLFKYIYDTDYGTGCNIHTTRESAEAEYLAQAEEEGFTEGSTYEQAREWQDNQYGGINTFFVEEEEIELPNKDQNEM